MPLYEFQCKKCEVVTEEILKIKEYSKKKFNCPKCGIKMEQTVGRPLFKMGIGHWSFNDYNYSADITTKIIDGHRKIHDNTPKNAMNAALGENRLG